MIVLTGLAAIVVLAWACHIHHTFPRWSFTFTCGTDPADPSTGLGGNP